MRKLSYIERESLKSYMWDNEQLGQKVTFTDVFALMKSEFGKRVNVIEVSELRREMGLTVFFGQ
jgi:hypothetical protein